MTGNKVEKLGVRVGRLEPIPPVNDDHARWDKVVAKLSPDEREAVSRVMKALEESDGRTSLETLPDEQTTAWARMMKLYEETT